MARETIMKCNFCGQALEQVTAKVYLAPVLPGKASTSFMSGYSHYADICENCLDTKFVPFMSRRQPRKNGNGTTTHKRTTKRKSKA